ncbi:unnamed protein product [Prunus armeniaca]|uniref:Uncharacterized protein n=1 Tax=Prunus armeniaca TaxID=36596 RepID=A0A6J5WNR9_PRUAR|nr:unnamed protein product [Prunus armeniaca]
MTNCISLAQKANSRGGDHLFYISVFSLVFIQNSQSYKRNSLALDINGGSFTPPTKLLDSVQCSTQKKLNLSGLSLELSSACSLVLSNLGHPKPTEWPPLLRIPAPRYRAGTESKIGELKFSDPAFMFDHIYDQASAEVNRVKRVKPDGYTFL